MSETRFISQLIFILLLMMASMPACMMPDGTSPNGADVKKRSLPVDDEEGVEGDEEKDKKEKPEKEDKKEKKDKDKKDDNDSDDAEDGKLDSDDDSDDDSGDEEVASFRIEPAVVAIEEKSSFQFTVVGGEAPFEFDVLSGKGSIDQDGLFSDPDDYKKTVVEVTDALGAKAYATIYGTKGFDLWLDASELELEDEEPVDVWADLTDGLRMTQDVPSMQPRFDSENLVNDLPVVSFDGNDKLNLETDILNKDKFTLLVAGKARAAGRHTFFYDEGTASEELELFSQNGIYNVRLSDDEGESIEKAHGSTETFGIYSLMQKDKKATLARNGDKTTEENKDYSKTSFEAGSNPRLGPLSGVLGEVILIKTDLNDSKREFLECYLSEKWGVSVSHDCD